MEPGSILAERFELLALAGKGGMGSVFRARDISSGAIVAVKTLARTEDEASRTRFLLEAKTLAGLSHPGIVRYVAHGESSDGTPFLAMEWLDGEDLNVRIQRQGLTITESVRLVSSIAKILSYAHERGVLHRDIKPGNLFLLNSSLEHPKLLDFGIARWNHSSRGSVTRTGVILGTPGYIAPEQARGTRGVDVRADVFALGCVLFECLSGQPAFAGEHILAVLAKILLADAPRVSALRGNIPAELDHLVAAMIAKDPADRPSSALDVMHRLEQIDLGEEQSEAPAQGSRDALTTSERRVWCVVLIGTSGHLSAMTPLDQTLSDVEATAARSSLVSMAQQFGARVEPLANGSVVVALTGRGMATDQAARAARCALALREAAQGNAIVLATGRGDGKGARPVGEVIDRAARLLQRALESGPVDGTSVYLDDVTAGLLGASFEVVHGGSIRELRGETDALSQERSLLGKPTSCVGRERELAMLDATLDGCINDSMSQLVLVTAVAGVGKSRLIREFLRRAAGRSSEIQIWIARADPMRAGSPYGLSAQWLRHAIRTHERESVSARQTKLREHVRHYVAAPDVDRVTEFLGELIGAAFDDTDRIALRAARQSPVLMSDQITSAWDTLLNGVSSAHPLLLLLEDAHWGDAPSFKLIDGALRNITDKPLLVLVTARPEVHDSFPNLWEQRGPTEIRLPSLSARASERLVREILGDRVSRGVITRVVEQAAGNAFFLEELIRAAASGDTNASPETVTAMVQTRLESLDHDLRRLLRAGSIFGQRFSLGAVASLLGERDLGADVVRIALAELVSQEVLVAPAPMDDDYTFRHAIVREAAYGMLTDEDRVLGHRLAGEWLAREGETAAAILAEHFERGQDGPRAWHWYYRAAEQALAACDHAAALVFTNCALVHLPDAHIEGELLSMRCLAYQDLANNFESEQEGVASLAKLREGSRSWFTTAGMVACTLGRQGKMDHALAMFRRLRDAVVPPESVEAHVAALAGLAGILLPGGYYKEADEALEYIAKVEAHTPMTETATRVAVHTFRGMRAIYGGNPAGQLEESIRALQCIDEVGDQRNGCAIRVAIGYASLELGQYERAETALREAMLVSQKLGLVKSHSTANHNLGLVLMARGALEEANAVETAALIEFDRQNAVYMSGAARVFLMRILVAQRNYVEAERIGAKAIENPSPPGRAYALAALAETLLNLDRRDEALHNAQDAMVLLDGLGSLDEGEAFVRLQFARALDANGERGRAIDAIGVAEQKLRERASKISDEFLRASFLENVAENAETLALAKAWEIGRQI